MKMLVDDVEALIEKLKAYGVEVDANKKRIKKGHMAVYLHSNSNVLRLLLILDELLQECKAKA